MNQYQTCLDCFECIFHKDSKYSNQISENLLHFCLVVCSCPPHCKHYPCENLQNFRSTLFCNLIILFHRQRKDIAVTSHLVLPPWETFFGFINKVQKIMEKVEIGCIPYLSFLSVLGAIMSFLFQSWDKWQRRNVHYSKAIAHNRYIFSPYHTGNTTFDLPTFSHGGKIKWRLLHFNREGFCSDSPFYIYV